VLVEIETRDRQLVAYLIDRSKGLEGSKGIDIPGNATITPKEARETKPSGSPARLVFVLAFGSGAASGLISRWLYEKIGRRASRIRIDRIEVSPSKEGIEKTIRDKVRRVCP
jgi:hypothetical protein